uniref:Uncharacterized protein n=4 Tax=Noccaea caerulescens TaxID=107243 RepID=A0A1J3JR11_NOCCA
MKSYESKEWDKLVPEAKARRIQRAKIESTVLTKKKLNKLTLKELIAKDDHEEDVRVTVEIMNVCTSFEDALKKFDAENHTEKLATSETGDYIYSIHLLISDGSLDGEVFNAYIYTYDGKGLEFLPDLQPSNIYGRFTVDSKVNYETFVNRLLEESDVNTTPL